MVGRSAPERAEGATVEVYGDHRFALLDDAVAPDEPLAWIRLSPAGLTPCACVEDGIELLHAFLRVWTEEDGLPLSDLPAGFGFMARLDGELVYCATADGRVHRLQHLNGASEAPATRPARISLFSLERDEAASGKHFVPAAADYWAMGRPT